MAGAVDRPALMALLGVDEQAPWEEVRRAFRNAVRATHPDLHVGDPAAEGRLKALNAAWEVVNTPDRWAQFVARAGMPDTDSPRESGADPRLGHMRVYRQRAGSAGLRHWKLELDGEVAATIENGGISVLRAGPGPHRLRVFYDRYSSLPLQVELRAGRELVLGCRQQSNALRTIYSPKRSLVLEVLPRRPRVV